MHKETFPFTYFGIPLFKDAPKKYFLHPIVDKILAQLTSWKGHTLSFARRIFLVNSVNTSIFIYSFMVYYWPRSLLDEMNVAIKNFVWIGSIISKKSVIVAWNKCCLPKEQGSLGTKNLVILNKAFLHKITQKFINSNS